MTQFEEGRALGLLAIQEENSLDPAPGSFQPIQLQLHFQVNGVSQALAWVLMTQFEEGRALGLLAIQEENSLDPAPGSFQPIQLQLHFQVVAASQGEPVPGQHPGRGPRRSAQLLAQHQALAAHVSSAVEDENPAAAVVPAERASHRHRCDGGAEASEGVTAGEGQGLGEGERGQLEVAMINSTNLTFIQNFSGEQLAPLTFSQALPLTGSYTFGRFGTAIAPLGDINQDGFNDVAVGCPFGGDDRGGRVLIFNGRRDVSGQGLVLSQELRAATGPAAGMLPGYGFTLRGGHDLDNNHYPAPPSSLSAEVPPEQETPSSLASTYQDSVTGQVPTGSFSPLNFTVRQWYKGAQACSNTTQRHNTTQHSTALA
ncbi:hypothetical protein CRUP_034629 [Coryphaenoides rupestris]|nr:hypothetical protein CRUP_034629 [Coryphaenoides rupestris]